MTSVPIEFERLSAAPFNLDRDAYGWVVKIFESLTTDEKINQILLPLAPNHTSDQEFQELAESGIGGVYRFANASPEFLRNSAEILGTSSVPLLMPSDLEFEEISAIGGIGVGTRFPNQLAVAGSGTTEASVQMATVGAVEGGAMAFNWSFTPVVDININFRNSLVNTRCFGDDAEHVKTLVAKYIETMESLGMASTIKHFPGDGVDERDQHTVPTKNSLTVDEWNSTFGEVFREAIGRGARTVMAGHISLPQYVLSVGGSIAEAYLPATFSPILLQRLLRDELGFNGLIVSDATEMGGFVSLGHRDDLVPACVQAGCDIVLFNDSGDHDRLSRALGSGQLTLERLNVAVTRVLALKASLGLHRGPSTTSALPSGTLEKHRAWAENVSKKSVTLVRDWHSDLPLRPDTHPRILLAMQQNRRNIFRQLPDLVVGELLTEAGFAVEIFNEKTKVDQSKYDALIYVVAEEGKQGKIHLHVNWDQLQPGFPHYMAKYFGVIPSVLLSFGSPYLSYDAPLCPVVINAYSPVGPSQRAAVDALIGRQAFEGVSPVNALAGIDEGERIASEAIPRARVR